MPEVVNKTSNQAVKKATGKDRDEWIKFLDKLGAVDYIKTGSQGACINSNICNIFNKNIVYVFGSESFLRLWMLYVRFPSESFKFRNWC
ncbi:hypothetical protein A2955_04455 [Candidatus Woesebacteria bacterium RIFCSPLOWO2_01_FULL_37_19]|uniref:Uncharacterized protein n=2 Tax=Candidatus Woeseibacteriota TaxID=1752722 RepID=A0A1F8B593_9BACT|nr:MAG: hypothetical protein A2771_02275 [Candidatus Woesebacteria bacterium RIFCSPHIGHO2_01_FULL_38_26b]OGM59214.1 MAG: hypothetical protein A2955_04455 [Candidatus Woesebacteria bacterium RIFCSPLOWO2_01_FULL_37_19]